MYTYIPSYIHTHTLTHPCKGVGARGRQAAMHRSRAIGPLARGRAQSLPARAAVGVSVCGAVVGVVGQDQGEGAVPPAPAKTRGAALRLHPGGARVAVGACCVCVWGGVGVGVGVDVGVWVCCVYFIHM